MGFMEERFGKNWLTSLGGLIALVGSMLGLLPKSLNIDPQWAIFVAGLGAAIGGFGAKSFNAHSTAAEVQTATKEKAVEDIKVASK
jgi:hypothetical protein